MITREKAIEALEKAKGLDDQFYAYTPIHYLESINMAIEALKAQETPIERVASDYGLKVDGVRFALEQYQTVICEITRSRMSKLSYFANDIIQLANEMMCEGCELQEAQEPVEPYGQYSVHTGTKYIVCGACEKPLCMMKDNYRPKYCPECGRMVKWHANEAEK